MQKDLHFFKSPFLDPNEASAYHWQALRLFNLYRFILTIGFLAVLRLHVNLLFFGSLKETLFQQATITYFLISGLVFLSSLIFKKQYYWQANIPIFIDIIAIIIIMHASGGIVSGLGILFIVIIAAHSLLIPGKLSYFSAATATIGLFIEQSLSLLSQNTPLHMYTQVGILGTTIFATSFVTNLLSQRARKSQLIIENQAQQLATSQQLNAYIVSAMHAGVLVLDNHQKIRLINNAARSLLGIQGNPSLMDINDLPVSFHQCLNHWQNNPHKKHTQQMTPSSPEVRLNFHPLGKGLPAGILVFVYNAAEEARHAQDRTLSSLGHLTANIAHELRNPLGAASHAAQLLAESNLLSSEDQYLVKMIKESCDRMNIVIQNVLSLSGRKPAQTQEIKLIPWLENFIQHLVIPHSPHPTVNLKYEERDLIIYADESQLTQILINLCENGLRYSLKKTNEAFITLRVKKDPHLNVIYLDVIDQGEGIAPHVMQHIFEPFFTTENSGSGLGLYIAKELSQMNGAQLEYCPTKVGCQFRITLPQEEAPS